MTKGLKEKFKNIDKYTKWAFIIIAVGVIIRFALASIYHISGDACWHFAVGKFIAENLKIPLYESFGWYREVFWAPPLFHLMIAFVYKSLSTFGETIASNGVKFISPFFSSLSLIFVYLIGKKLFNKKVALYSLVFFSFVPISIYHGSTSSMASTLTFFCLLAVYFALHKRVFLSGVGAGLAILTKYSGVLIIPVILYIIWANRNKNKNLDFFKKCSIFIFTASVIGLPWLIRNYILIGNPVAPFFGKIFGVYITPGGYTFNLLNIFSLKHFSSFYLALFGVPEGSFANLFFFDIPFLNYLLIIWFIGTLFFIFPFFTGLFKIKHINFKEKINKERGKKKGINNIVLFVVWAGSFLVLMFFHIAHIDTFFTRIFFPAIPVLAFIWGFGFNKIKIKPNWLKMVAILVLILCIFGFIVAEFVKISLASKSWQHYEGDYEWIRENTPKNSIFYYNGQCLTNNIDRFVKGFDKDNLKKGNFVWVNQEFKLESVSILPEEDVEFIEENYLLVYNNSKTNTRIYEVI